MAADASESIDVVLRPDFLNLMAHELSQPLTAALGSVSTLRDGIDTEGFEETRDKLIQIAIRNLEQLQALLDSLRIFTEADAGNILVEKTRVPVSELFREAEENFGSPSSGTRITFTSEPGLMVDVEMRLFRQVLTNVIANAGKFSPNGTLITVEAHKGENDGIVFTVSDEGPGIPSGEAEHIFERSVRLQTGKKGLGLGLFVAMAIVMAHGGRIWAENINGGARFSVVIPS
jgi:two-component system, OmpR family, sensor histidine kinase KdpD